MNVLTAPRPAETAIPTRMSRIGVMPCFQASVKISMAVAPAPTNANSGMVIVGNTLLISFVSNIKYMKSTTASPAPALIPSIPGSASALRDNPCRMTPDTASPQPMSSAMTMRGIRNWNSTVSCCWVPPPNSVFTTSSGDNGIEPEFRLMRKTAIIIAASSPITREARPCGVIRNDRIIGSSLLHAPDTGRTERR